MTAEEKNKYDAYMKQAEFLEQRVANRQSYQWKITLGLWALIAASTQFICDKKPHVDRCVVLLFMAAVFAGYTLIWVRWIANRNHRDQQYRSYFTDEARHLIGFGERPKQPSQTNSAFFHCHPAHLFECLGTLVLLVAAYLLIAACGGFASTSAVKNIPVAYRHLLNAVAGVSALVATLLFSVCFGWRSG